MGKYANDRVERLVASNITPEHTLMSRKTISVAENGRRYSVDIVNGAESVAYPIDGVAISDGNKCDKFVAALKKDDGIAVFVELKVSASYVTADIKICVNLRNTAIKKMIISDKGLF